MDGVAIADRALVAQIREIAEIKMEDLNAASLEAAMKTISGTARSMGIEVTE